MIFNTNIIKYNEKTYLQKSQIHLYPIFSAQSMSMCAQCKYMMHLTQSSSEDGSNRTSQEMHSSFNFDCLQYSSSKSLKSRILNFMAEELEREQSQSWRGVRAVIIWIAEDFRSRSRFADGIVCILTVFSAYRLTSRDIRQYW